MYKILTLFTFIFFTTNNGFTQNIHEHTLQMQNGDLVKLNKFKNKIIVMNLWFIGCGPCVQEMPVLNNLVDKYKNDTNVVFIAVTGDENIDTFLQKHKFNYIHAVNGRNFCNMFQGKYFASYPKHLIFDRNGNLSLKTGGARGNIDDVLAKHIEKIKRKT